MMKRLSLGAVLISATVSFAAESARAAQVWEKWSDAITATEQQRPLAILITSEICTPCQDAASITVPSSFRAVTVEELEAPRVAAAYREAARVLGISAELPVIVVTTRYLDPIAAFPGIDASGGLHSLAAEPQPQLDARIAAARLKMRQFRLDSHAPAATSLAHRAAQWRSAIRSDDRKKRDAAVAELRALTSSAVFDQLGGGFHHHAHDRELRVPSFEKSLIDQAYLTLACIDAWKLTGEWRFAEVGRMTATAIVRDFKVTKGDLFYAGLKSKSLVPLKGPSYREGGAYTWDAAEVRHLLGDADAAIFFAHYGLTDEGNVPRTVKTDGELEGKNILHLVRPVDAVAADRMERARAKLLDVRLNRPPAPADERVITSANALAISALSRAALEFKSPYFGDAAERAARALLTKNYDHSKRTLLRFAGVAAQGDDYFALTHALLDVYAVSLDPFFLERAIEVQQVADARLWSEEKKAYDIDRGVPSFMADLADRSESMGLAFSNLRRLGDLFERNDLRERASLIAGLRIAAPKQFVIIGAAAHEGTRLLLASLDAIRPDAPVLVIRNAKEKTRLRQLAPYIASIEECTPTVERGCPPVGVVCVSGSCGTPTSDAERFAALAGSAKGHSASLPAQEASR